MTAPLTERYVAAVIRTIPPASRDDVQTELEVSIADAVDARIAEGEAPADAEKAVLTDLGNPAVLAAGYLDRPLHLIGPHLYLLWWRILKLVWAIVLPVAMGGVALSEGLDGASVGGIIGSAISVGLAAVVYVGFWVTLVFAVLDRTTGNSLPLTWNVDMLPRIQPKGAGKADMIAAFALLATGFAALFWDRFIGFVFVDSEWLPILNPTLWPWWITGLLVIMTARAALDIAAYFAGRWTRTSAVINSAIALAFAIPATALLVAGDLVNPNFVALVFTNNGVDAETLHTLAIITGVSLIGFPVWAIIDGWWKAVRDSRR